MSSNLYTGFYGTTGQETDTTKYRHKLLNNSVTFGTLVTCQFDLNCGNLTANSIYGGAATQITNAINNAVSTKQDILNVLSLPGQISLLNENLVKPLQAGSNITISDETTHIVISATQSSSVHWLNVPLPVKFKDK